MYCAVNPTDPTLPASIAQQIIALRLCHIGQPVYVYLMVDGVFDEPLVANLVRQAPSALSLYAHTRLEGFKTASPHLIPVPVEDEQLLWWLEPIFRKCSGKPMLSVIASTLTGEHLQQHLRPYLICITPDTTEWPLRWADTRVLPPILDNLTPSQRKHLMSPIHRWWSVKRDGGLHSWEGASVRMPEPAAFERLAISDITFSALVDAGDADSMIAILFRDQPDLMRRDSPSECHARILRNLVIANESRIVASGARIHFCVLAKTQTDNFAKNMAMRDMLRNIQNGADYFSEFENLSNGFWYATSIN